MTIRSILAAIVLSACAPAAAQSGHDELQGSVSWTLGFGKGVVEPVLQLAAGLANGSTFDPLGEVLHLRLSRHSALAAVGGLPVAIRQFSASQSGGAAVIEEREPWYSQSWVLWTGAGVVGLGIAAGLDSENSNDEQCTGVCDQECEGNTLSTCNGRFCVQDDQNCLPPNPVISLAAYALPMEVQETILDDSDLHGGMGDLSAVAR